MKDRQAARTRFGTVDALALGGLALFCLVLLWQLVLAGRMLAGPDAFSYFYPLYDYTSTRLLAGQLPLWNPYLFMGAPFLANSQAGVFYPLHWPLLAMAAPHMATATLALHCALLAAFTYLLLRFERGNSPLAAVIGGVVLVAGGLVGSQAEHFNQVEAIAWLPLQVLLLRRATRGFRGGGRRRPLPPTEVGAAWPAAGRPPSRTQSPASLQRDAWRLLAPPSADLQSVGHMAAGAAARQALPLAAFAGAALVACLQLLAGHTQAAFICQTGLLAAAVLYAWSDGADWRQRSRLAVTGVSFVVLAAALGAAMAAVQLLPTFELSGLSIRAGGLTYRQAVAFSFGPRAWLMGLLPHFGREQPFGEYAAWVGVAALVLVGVGAVRGPRRRWPALGLAVFGLFLAVGGYNPLYYVLYRLVPGFDLFRVPARWLVLYALGVAMLAADGLDALAAMRPRWRLPLTGWRLVAAAGLGLVGPAALLLLAEPRPEWKTLGLWAAFGVTAVALVVVLRPGARRYGAAALVVVELLAASQVLPYNQGTAAETYLAERRSLQAMGDTGLYRFLTVSDGEFDAGDMADLTSTLGRPLGTVGRYELLVTSKMQELLSRNLALHWQRYAVGGYDGGVLPTEDFLAFERLYAGERASADGRLSEVLPAVPRLPLLALANVRYVITDRVDDLWLDGIYYDLGQPLALAPGEEAVVIPAPQVPADAVGVVLAAGGSGEVLRLTAATGRTFAVTAQGDSVSATGDDGTSAAGQAVAGRPGLFYLRLPLGKAQYADRIELAAGATSGVTVMAVSLITEAASTGTVVPLGGGLTPLHYGDVKVYEFDGTLPRAYFAGCVRHVATADEALAAMAAPDFDPRRETIVVGAGSDACQATPVIEVQVVIYAPESVTLAVDAPAAGYVALLDSYYPGWLATVDGQPAPVLRANYAFRAVPVAAGSHTVTFTYRPASLRYGALASAAGWATWLVLCAGGLLLRRGAVVRRRMGSRLLG